MLGRQGEGSVAVRFCLFQIALRVSCHGSGKVDFGMFEA